LAMQRGEMEELKAFTVDWRPLIDDPEPHFANLTATHLGLAHQLLAEQAVEPFAKSDAPADHSPQPTSEPFFSLAQKQYREIARHSRVILSGDGGDNVLAGQSWPYFVHLWNSGQRPEIARVLSRFIWERHSFPPLRAGLRARFRQLAGRTDEWDGYPDWLNPEFEARCGLREKWAIKLRPSDRRHPIHPIAYAGLHDGYWSTVLESEDAGNTHIALETRAPLLDLRVLRFLLRVPPVPWCINKDLVRRSMRNLLPPAVLSRPKTPLVGDPLEVCAKTGKWAPNALECLPPSFSRFVDIPKWRATLKHSQGYTSGPNLFLLAFVRWLKDIENEEGIE
jgi:asparagine synthase (glutamine-hydrolysing)